VTKGSEAAGKLHIVPAQRKTIDGSPVKAPPAIILLVLRVEYGISPVKGTRVPGRPPALWFGAHHCVGTVSLELSTVAGIQQGIVRPSQCGQYFRGLGDYRGHEGCIKGKTSVAKTVVAGIGNIAILWRGLASP
jgi:hypothetical protein